MKVIFLCENSLTGVISPNPVSLYPLFYWPYWSSYQAFILYFVVIFLTSLTNLKGRKQWQRCALNLSIKRGPIGKLILWLEYWILRWFAKTFWNEASLLKRQKSFILLPKSQRFKTQTFISHSYKIHWGSLGRWGFPPFSDSQRYTFYFIYHCFNISSSWSLKKKNRELRDGIWTLNALT